jgi:hypothetical protein
MNRRLVEYIKRSSPDQYCSFVECLRRSHQQHVADLTAADDIHIAFRLTGANDVDTAVCMTATDDVHMADLVTAADDVHTADRPTSTHGELS